MPASPPPATFYKGQNYRAEESVGYLMKRVLLSLASQTDKRLAPHDLTTAQWGPLVRMQMQGPTTVVELARWSNTDAGAMTRLLDRLEKKGLCKRVRSTQDRRVVNVEITPEGESAIEHVPAALAEVMNLHLAGFSRSEWLALRGFLQRMADTGESLK